MGGQSPADVSYGLRSRLALTTQDGIQDALKGVAPTGDLNVTLPDAGRPIHSGPPQSGMSHVRLHVRTGGP
ncbi:hypothetical protein GCM10009589_21820 [Arthrobacter pascens]